MGERPGNQIVRVDEHQRQLQQEARAREDRIAKLEGACILALLWLQQASVEDFRFGGDQGIRRALADALGVDWDIVCGKRAGEMPHWMTGPPR